MPFYRLFFLAVWIAGSSTAPGALWFGDLVKAEPVPAPAQLDLARYMTRMAFERGQPTMEPPESLREDREPRMLFLSLGDGVSRARVVRSVGRGLAEAASGLRAQVKALAEDGFKVRFVRVDLVTEVRPVLVNPNRPLALERSLYGVAFDRQLKLAFLADESVTHTLIDSDQRLRLHNVRKRPEARAARTQLDALSQSGQVPLFRFATSSFFSDGGEPVLLYRGHRRFTRLTPDQLLHHARLGGQYLTRSVDSSGRFVYAYLPKTDEQRDQYNALRHCGTIYSMLELYEVTQDVKLLQAAERAIGYLEQQLLGRCTVNGKTAAEETACVVEDGEVKLGGNGLAIVALAKHAEVTGETRHLKAIDDLGRWILLTQNEDGEFKIHKQLHPSGEVTSFVSGYYPGEALLALVRRPEPDPDWIDAAARGARWLIDVRDRGLSIEALNHDHWLLYALNELHRLRPDPSYLEHATRITTAILKRQRQHEPGFQDWLGSYYKPPRSTPTATRSEGLAAAYLMMSREGQAKSAAAILDALKLGTAFQLQTQFLPETVLYLRDPARALGGFRRSLTHYEIRIDYVQHNISALLLLRRILLNNSKRAR